MPTGDQRALGGDIGSLKPARIEESSCTNLLIFNGVPNNNVGLNGQYAFRVDSTTAGTRMYQKVGGIWTAIAGV